MFRVNFRSYGQKSESIIIKELFVLSEHQIIISVGGATVKCVKEVDAFTEKEIKLTIDDSKRLVIEGENLKICDFSKNTGDLSVSGKVTMVKYAAAAEKFFKRLFK